MCNSNAKSEVVMEGSKCQSSRTEPKKKNKRSLSMIVGVCKNGHWKPTESTSADAAARALNRLLNRR